MKTKDELFDIMNDMGIDNSMIVALCNYHSTSELNEFVEFLEEEGF